MKLMFFEDEYAERPNVKFRLELIEELPGLRLDYASTVDWFNQFMRRTVYDAFIIDIMTPEGISGPKGVRVDRTRVGIELLRRLREGYYAHQRKDALIIMRTARSTEPGIREICVEVGADHVLSPGGDDHEIIEILRSGFAISGGRNG